jgi:predicted phage terminase large subunit-like protein
MVSSEQQIQYWAAEMDFFHYASLMAPDFYIDDRAYLVELCETLQDFMESVEDDVLVINMPPRHGKSRTASLFSSWLFGVDPSTKIMTGSYNEKLATVFSKAVRGQIQTKKADEDIVVFSDIFPQTRIARGDAAMNLWSLEGEYSNYLATAPKGSATGFGAKLIIIDDLIKNDKEAFNDNVLDDQWSWFTDTMLSRLENGGKIIIIMTRWSSKDLAGRALELLPEMGFSVKHINRKALQDDGSMLCDDVLSKKQFEQRRMAQSQEIFSANYQQEPIDLQGALYKTFMTYELGTQPQFIKVWNYTDTADTGEDYLCSIVFGETADHRAYILDLVYTQEQMDTTEPLIADLLDRNKVNVARIESNNGGRGFARNVMREINGQTVVDWFYQSDNKQARIYSNSAWVQANVFYPENWKSRWPEYAEAMKRYQSKGKNAHDDAPDATTGIAETLAKAVVKVGRKPKALRRRR